MVTLTKTRVVHLTSGHPPFDIRIFYKECKTLAEAGYEVVLIAPHNRSEVIDGIRIQAVPKPKDRLGRMVHTGWRVFRAALSHEKEAALFHIHDPELLPWAQLLRLINKRPVIYDMHENVPKALLTKQWISPPIRRLAAMIYSLLEWLFIKNMPVVYAEKSYANDYQWVDEGTVILNMPIVDLLSNLNEPKYSVPTVGYIGAVVPQRGSLITLEALRILKQRGYAVNWECVGDSDEIHKMALTRFIEENDLDGIHLHGYMLPDDAYQILARCHVGLAILQPIPNYIESYPTKMFEYMALGLPVVASKFPLYREIIEVTQCGFCVDPRDAVEVAEALLWLIEHGQQAEAMGARGREAVLTKYSWSHEAPKLKTLYQKLLKGYYNESRTFGPFVK